MTKNKITIPPKTTAIDNSKIIKVPVDTAKANDTRPKIHTSEKQEKK